MTINFHIERVMFDGVGVQGRDAARLQRAMEAEIARQLRDNAAIVSNLTGGAVAEIPAVELRVDDATTPSQWGRGIANSILRGFGK
jgi:hypothetical protein